MKEKRRKNWLDRSQDAFLSPQHTQTHRERVYFNNQFMKMRFSSCRLYLSVSVFIFFRQETVGFCLISVRSRDVPFPSTDATTLWWKSDSHLLAVFLTSSPASMGVYIGEYISFVNADWTIWRMTYSSSSNWPSIHATIQSRSSLSPFYWRTRLDLFSFSLRYQTNSSSSSSPSFLSICILIKAETIRNYRVALELRRKWNADITSR